MLAACLLAVSLAPPAARLALASCSFRRAALSCCTDDYVPFQGRRESYVPPWSQQHGAAGNVYREMQSEYEQYAQQNSNGVRFIASKAELDSLLAENADRPTVVDFTAQWCKPCQEFTPKFEALAQEFGPRAAFVAVDVDDNPETALACGISAMPTIKVFKNQAERAMIPGANEAALRAAVRAVEQDVSFGGEGTRDSAAAGTGAAKYCKYDAIRSQLAASRARSYEQGRSGCCGKATDHLGSSGPPPDSPWARGSR